VRVRGGLALKVAFHVDQLWFSAPGGIGTYVDELMWSALRDADPSLELVPFASRWRHSTTTSGEPLTLDGRPWAVHLPFSIRVLYPAWDLFNAPALPRVLRDCDVVHATNPAAVPPVRPGQKLAVTVHDLAFERFPKAFPSRWLRLYRAGLRAATRRAHAIITPSEATKRDLVELTGYATERVHVTPLGPAREEDATPEQLRAREEDFLDHGPRRPFILHVGTIEPRKNLVRLLRAYRRLAGEGLPHQLVLVGPRGWNTQEFDAELAKEGPGTVVGTGEMGRHLVDAAYRLADAVAYPSLYEGFGLPVLEAMSHGVPTVASNISSIPEVAGDAALLVDPTDEDAIAGALRRVLTDEEVAADLRRRGRQRAAGFSWEETARATLRVYRELVEGA